ncbi:MAG: GAF domain-containing protein [Acidobacteriota bacterium]
MPQSPEAASPFSTCLRLTRAISRSAQLPDIYEAALDALSEGLDVQRASILLFDPDGVMRFKAWRGLSDRYRAAVEGHTPWRPNERGAQPIIVPDVSLDAELQPYLPTFAAEGIAGLVFVPLETSAGVIGKFMLYSAEPHQPSPDELALAELIAAQVAIAVAQSHTTRAAQQLAAIVESSDDVILSKSLEGIITSWNGAAERMFGYTAAEAVGQPIFMIVPPERYGEERGVLERVRAGQPVEMETERRRKDGSTVAISLMVSPVRDSQGRIVGASKIARDITARKRNEAERAELHRRLTTLVTASASLLGSPEAESVRSATLSLARQLLSADGFALWSGQPGQPWQVERSEGISKTFAARVVDPPPGSAALAVLLSRPTAVADVSAQPLLAHQHREYEAEGIRSILICPMRLDGGRAGTLTFYYRTPHSFSDAEIQTGQALANIAAAALATAELYDQQRRERQEAEHARRQAAFLADATALLSRSLDYEHTLAAVARLAVPEIADWCAVDIVDDAGALQRLAVAHVDPAKLELARVLQQRYPPNPSSSVGAYQVIRTGKPVLMPDIPAGLLTEVAVDDEHLRLLKALALASYICVPLLSSTGTFGAITFVFAESNRHYTERDVAFALDVASRASLAIENAFAYRRANEANRVKDEFLATLSHELRTPLNAILGYAQIINQGVYKGEREANAMGVLTRNAEALGQIIDDILDVSRITSGKLCLKAQPVRMEDILGNAIATVQPAADAKRVSIRLVAEPGAGAVSGDPDRLQQVIWNLLSNAVKFTPPDGRVDLRLERANGAVQIIVKDEGQGIDPAFLPHLFERFRQADSRLSREHGGLGLGLAIARELVELHGGTVSGSSDGPGTGATFIVRLPQANREPSSGPVSDAGLPA